jgi:membrane associated rhomboid family serine protease
MRFLSPRNRDFLTPPRAAGALILILNIAVYGFYAARLGIPVVPADVLLQAGALYPGAIERHEYWRLVVYGFVHAGTLQLAGNMLCLLFWAGHLEARIGTLYFLLVYLCAMIAAGLAGIAAAGGAHLVAGASGAVSGVLGALVCLWLLGKVDVSGGFIVANLALNAFLAMGWPGGARAVDLAGFAAGLVTCGLLELIERANAHALRCKFPEFVKMNVVVAAGTALYLFEQELRTLFVTYEWPLLVVAAVGALALIKAVDLVLALEKGLVVVVLVLALVNAAIVSLYADAWKCTIGYLQTTSLIGSGRACATSTTMVGVIAASAFAATVLLYGRELRRGIKDVGFVGNSLKAERRRRRGL